MSVIVGESHDGDAVRQNCRHIRAPGASDLLSQAALLKFDTYNATAEGKVTYTLWVDSARELRILGAEPTAAQLAGLTTAVGTVVGTQS